jgi:hypothetical protein
MLNGSLRNGILARGQDRIGASGWFLWTRKRNSGSIKTGIFVLTKGVLPSQKDYDNGVSELVN